MRRERLAVMTRFVPLAALVLVLCGVGLSAGRSDAASTTTPRCSPAGYGLEQQVVARASVRRRAVRLTAGWLAAREGHRPCALRTTIRVLIRDAGGVEARARWSVQTVLYPWSASVHTWVWRNWCSATKAEPTVKFSLPDGTSVKQHVSDPPTCRARRAPTTLADLGTGTKYAARHGERIPPHILPPDAPPPLHFELIDVNNAWLVSDGDSLVAVYAGTARNNPSLGRFAIIRQYVIFGVQFDPPVLIGVPNAGALKITSAPTGDETLAQRGRLTFTSATGIKGVLDLSTDRVRVISP